MVTARYIKSNIGITWEYYNTALVFHGAQRIIRSGVGWIIIEVVYEFLPGSIN
jgi:hypothetical protein